MSLKLDDDRRGRMIESLRGIYLQEFEEELSAFRAELLLDFFLDTIGPQIYNQAVQDARAYMQRKLDDLDGEVFVAEQAI